MTDVPPTPPATLSRAREIALRHGLRYVYTGNVHDADGGSTFCPGCGRAVLVRDWYRILRYELTDDGACAACGTRIPGVYDGPAGHWGARRLPLFVGGLGHPAADRAPGPLGSATHSPVRRLPRRSPGSLGSS